MRIGIVGTGISGLVCAHLLHDAHELTIFEANDYIGGHTHTVEVPQAAGGVPVDTGFIVYNDRTYPNFIRLLTRLGVAGQATEMSFSVHCERTGQEYSGSSLNTLFAQRRNLLRPSFLGMVRDILRFNREAPRLLAAGELGLSMGEFLDRGGYGQAFRDLYILPMAAAIWSSQNETVLSFPALFFVRFFKNHGLLDLQGRPQWYVVKGGSRSYVEAITPPFRDRIRLASPVVALSRSEDGVRIATADGTAETFDEVIVAAHSDQARAMLADPTPAESEILGRIPYQENATYLHTDTALMPRNRLAWASWNSRIPRQPDSRVAVTYNMNILQKPATDENLLITLNHIGDAAPERILQTFHYAHPQFSTTAVEAQQRWAEISGVNRTHYCGAYWRNGFHEDGVVSALRVCEHFGLRPKG